MGSIDVWAPINLLLMGLPPLILLVAAYFVNRWLDLIRKRHADGKVESAITQGVALAAVTVPPEKQVVAAASFVVNSVPTELKVLNMATPVIVEKIKARVAASRSMII